MTVKKLFGSSCGLNSDIFSTARAEGLVSQVAPAAATHILYRRMYVVNRGIVRSVSQQQVHKCGRILSGEKNHLSREKYLASHRVTPMCARQAVLAAIHILAFSDSPHLTFPHALQRHKCDRACQSKSSIHTHAAASGIACTPYRGLPQGYSWKRPPISPSSAQPLKSQHAQIFQGQ